ncbi:fumarate hydratase, class I [Novimethylophilus kurashikiensis]|uniref:Fumarate hydratase class I n=1 Tax=Novimethylophilus kurashikiensis TaxID=1825523 RepID=A0A2R5FAK6_9PROT|nr:fumarate hydratase [Novimethylophilus kurashikiensis]GBG15256.1 fumarate hydratase, class I [Novimethylophilus kurashikiensis]
MSIIREQDLIDSVYDALQYIACYHSPDFIKSLHQAYEHESSPAARDALAQILLNSYLCAQDSRPLCQDTGIVVAFVKVGMSVTWDTYRSLQEMIDDGVRRAYRDPDNTLRASIVSDPAGKRRNTGDNSPAVVHVELVPGDKLEISIAAKGGGSENKSHLAMLEPSDDIVEWVLETIPKMGAGWCPPGVLGIGIGGTAEKAVLMAKESLMAPIDIQQLKVRGPANRAEELRLELYDKVNKLGIGAQGLGGLSTVLDVKVVDYPTHATSLPVAIIPNCAATRHIHFTLDGNGPAKLPVPKLEDWPQVALDSASPARRIDLDALKHKDIQQWHPGEKLLLSGKLLTGRDAAHKRIVELMSKGESLPDGVDFTNRFIYYVGPVNPVRDEAVGPAGPTTATRMDRFTDFMLKNTGLLGMIGKAERGEETVASIKQHGSVYLIAVGGAGYLVSKAIKSARVVAFEDLGMEAIYEFIVEDMPVTVAVDSRGESVHLTGPEEWKARISNIPVVTA